MRAPARSSHVRWSSRSGRTAAVGTSEGVVHVLGLDDIGISRLRRIAGRHALPITALAFAPPAADDSGVERVVSACMETVTVCDVKATRSQPLETPTGLLIWMLLVVAALALFVLMLGRLL